MEASGGQEKLPSHSSPYAPEEGGEVREPAKEGGWGPFPRPLESGLGCPAASGPEVEGRQDHTVRKLTKKWSEPTFSELWKLPKVLATIQTVPIGEELPNRAKNSEPVAFSLGLLKILHSAAAGENQRPGSHRTGGGVGWSSLSPAQRLVIV